MSHQFLVIIRPLTEIDSNYYKLCDLMESLIQENENE